MRDKLRESESSGIDDANRQSAMEFTGGLLNLVSKLLNRLRPLDPDIIAQRPSSI